MSREKTSQKTDRTTRTRRSSRGDSLPVKPVSEVQQHRSMVVYGRSGSGKTTFAATFPKPILLLDVSDKGTDSISDVEKIDVMEVETWQDLELAYWYLNQNPEEYETVVVDTLSQAQELLIKKLLLEKYKGDEEAQSGFGSLSQRDWGEVTSVLKTWITHYRNLPMEVLFIAQDRIFEVDEDLDPETMLDPEVGPRLAPSVTKHLNASVHSIGNTFIRRRIRHKEVKRKGSRKTKTKEIPETQYCLRIGPDPVYATKIRKPKGIKVPAVIVDPHYDDILELIQGG